MARPRWEPGDLLYVREEFSGPHAYAAPVRVPPRDWTPGCPIHYWADGDPADSDWTKPKPGMHQPRWASRITLRVAEVRQEPLKSISVADCMAEGLSTFTSHEHPGRLTLRYSYPRGPHEGFNTPHAAYFHLWDAINGKTAPVSSNPDVWVTRFEPAILQNVDSYLQRHAPSA